MQLRIASLVLLAGTGWAHAQSPTNEELFRLVQTLRSEVGELRRQAGRDRQDAEQARAELRAYRTQRAPSVGRAAAPPPPSGSATVASAPAPILPVVGEITPFVGAAFGVGTTPVTSRGATLSQSSSRSVSSFPPFPPTVSTSSSTEGSLIQGRSREEAEASLALVAGAKYQLGERLFVGAQVDGALHQGTSRLPGTTVSLPGTGTFNGVPQVGSSGPSVASRLTSFSPEWTASAVGMLGTKLTDDLGAYALGGVTYARFRVDDGAQNGRDAVGPTVGGGAEYRIYGGWALSAEYRYTTFEPVVNRTRSTSFASSIFPGQTSTFNSVTVTNEKFTPDMHAARIGLKYYFE